MQWHHNFRSGVRCFLGENSYNSSSSLLSNAIFKNVGNGLNEVNADTFEKTISSESERNKGKRGHWSD